LAPGDREWTDVVALVTGANTGIGRSTAARLATLGATVVLGCRSIEKAEVTRRDLIESSRNDRIRIIALDLCDLAAVRAAAAEVLAIDQPLHLLINNAGIAGQRGQTVDGFELAFGTNHLGHFLLTQLLIPKLIRSAPARVVTVASGNHFRPTGIDFDKLREPTPSFVGLREYNVSKLCNVLFTQELARRHDPAQLSAFSANPGPVASEVWRRMPDPAYRVYQALRRMKSTEEGARPTLRCATELGLESLSGAYVDENLEIIPVSRYATQELAGELWTRSEAWVA
jgi:retinol dehydrogenase-12